MEAVPDATAEDDGGNTCVEVDPGRAREEAPPAREANVVPTERPLAIRSPD